MCFTCSGERPGIFDVLPNSLLPVQGPHCEVSVTWNQPIGETNSPRSSALEAVNSELEYWNQLSQQSPASPAPATPAGPENSLSGGGSLLEKLRQGSKGIALPASVQNPASAIPPGTVRNTLTASVLTF